MKTHSSIPAWEIPWTEKPGGLQSSGLQRIGYQFAFKQNYKNKTKQSKTKRPKMFPIEGREKQPFQCPQTTLYSVKLCRSLNKKQEN